MKSSLHIVTRYKLGGADCWILTILLVDGYIPGCENAFFFSACDFKIYYPKLKQTHVALDFRIYENNLSK